MTLSNMKRHWSSLAFAFLLVANSASAERREFTYSVAAEIDTNGHVVSAHLKAKDVTEAFADTIEGLVKQWRFRPAVAHGAPATATTMLITQVVVDIDENQSAKITARYLRHGAEASWEVGRVPTYPARAMRASVSAEVAVVVDVQASGISDKVELYSLRMTSKDKRTGEAFVREALETVRTWRFAPETVNGQAVATRMVIPIKFSIGTASAKRQWHDVVTPTSTALPELDFNRQQAIALNNATGLEFISDGSQG